MAQVKGKTHTGEWEAPLGLCLLVKDRARRVFGKADWSPIADGLECQVVETDFYSKKGRW